MKTKHSLSVAVFCSAAIDICAQYYEQTEQLGRWIGEQGYRLVYGGASLGLMECIACAAKKAGAELVGVVPNKLVERNLVSNQLDVNIPVCSLGERKEIMMRESDVFIALPGGLGTLDEVFHVLGEASIGYHAKPIILYNINGCWNSLLGMFEDLRRQKLLRHDLSAWLIVADSLEEVRCFLERQGKMEKE